MSDQFFWFATRAAGIMAWFSALASVAFGLLLSSRLLGRRPTIPWLTDVHRFLAALSVGFVVLHMASLWADSFVAYSWAELLVPGVATAEGVSRLALAMGVVSAWLLALIQATSLVMRRLPTRFWHGVHLSSYAVVLLTTIHGWQSGSDAANPALIAGGASVLALIVLLGGIRVTRLLADRKFHYEQSGRPAARR
jgi:methionine sulfoxide reductase heme-binding subunit